MAERRCGGFSLVECLLAIAVFAIAGLALAQLTTLALQGSKLAEFNLKATELAQGRVETLKQQYNKQLISGEPVADLVAGQHGPEVRSLHLPSGTAQTTLDFQVSWSVADLAKGEKSIQVTVEQVSGGAFASRPVTIASYFSP